MYRRIFVAVDGSKPSTLGLRHAIALAKSQRARLRVLNVLDQRLFVPGLAAYSEADLAVLIGDSSVAGRKAVKEAAALASRNGVKAEPALAEGRGRLVSDVILDDAKKWRADLIVMGTHGHRGFKRLLLGSDAERVLRDAPVPVLLVHRDKPKRRIAKKRAGRRR